MYDPTISVSRLVAGVLWALAVIGTVVPVALGRPEFSNVGILLGLAATAATVRCWCLRLAGLTRLVGGMSREPEERLRSVL